MTGIGVFAPNDRPEMTTVKITHHGSGKTTMLSGTVQVTGAIDVFFAMPQEEIDAFIETQIELQRVCNRLSRSLLQLPILVRLPKERSTTWTHKPLDARFYSSPRQHEQTFRRTYTSGLQRRRAKRRNAVHALRRGLKLSYIT